MKWRAPASSWFHCSQLTTRVGLTGFLEVGERLVWWEAADSWWTLSPYVIPLFLLLDEWWLPGQRSLSHSEDKHWKTVGTFQRSHPLHPKTRNFSVGDRGPSQGCHRGHRDIIRDQDPYGEQSRKWHRIQFESNAHLEILTQKIVFPYLLLRVVLYFMIYFVVSNVSQQPEKKKNKTQKQTSEQHPVMHSAINSEMNTYLTSSQCTGSRTRNSNVSSCWGKSWAVKSSRTF